jgi:hypothetical protein
MPREPNPLDDELLYDGIVLGGVQSPGKVTLSGHDRKVGWDVVVAKGHKGATTNLKDIPPIEFTASFYLVRDVAQGIDDLADWPAFRTLINSTISGPKPKALDIYHPDLAANDIKSVVLASFGGVVHDGKGGQTITVKFQEYAPPKPKGGSLSGSKKQGPDPDAAAKKQIADLIDQYNSTPWGDGTKKAHPDY